MHLQCPRCRSIYISVNHYGRQAGSLIGTVAGATGGVVSALQGARIGASMGAILGPIGSSFGGLSGAIIAGLLGGAAGGSAGAAVGDFVDHNILNKYACLSCGHAFSKDTSMEGLRPDTPLITHRNDAAQYDDDEY